MKEKNLLRKLGQETIYSAKGHFKSADIRRIQTKWTIVLCMILNVIGIIGISEMVDKWLSAFGLLGTFFLFYWDAEEGKDYRAKHKATGERYLSLHKEIRECYFLSECQPEDVKQLNERVVKLDQETKPEIPHLARKWAQRAIEKDDETDNWFLKGKQ